MKIGILNQLLPGWKTSLGFAGTTLPVIPEAPADPLKGEVLTVGWQQIKDQPIALTVTLPQKAFVDRVVLTLGESTRLVSAVLTDGSGVLCRYCAETGKTVTASVLELEAGLVTDTLEIQLESFFSGIVLEKAELYGALEDGIDLFPIPASARSLDKLRPANSFATYSGSSEAGSILAEKFLEKTGVALSEAAEGDIRFVTDPNLPADGYTLTVREDAAVIAASNYRGLVCGAECFIKLTDPTGVACAEISDAPDRPFRGVHLFLPSVAEMPFAKRLIKYLISPMGYNNVIIEVGAGMRFDSHPEVNEAFLEGIEKSRTGEWPEFPHGSVAAGTVVEKKDVRAFVDYIKRFGIEAIPEIQSLGHVQYLTQAYPEIAEREDKDYNAGIDARGEDFRPDSFYAHCYCPSNEKSYEILFDIADEIIEVFRPTSYVHMGHDEVYQIGLCPKCVHTDPAELYARDVNRIHAYLAAKGLKMMIWSDMIQPCTRYHTPPAIDLIPRDILMLDFIWYFHFDKDLEDNLLSKGFKVAVGNLYSSHYPRYESRMAKENMVGGQLSTWVGTNEAAIQQEGKFFDLFLTANMLWNADSYSHCHNLLYDRMISARMPRLREQLRQVKYPSLAEGAEVKVLLENPITFPPAAPSQKTEFAVDADCASLVLYHTCLRKLTRYPWTKNDVVGQYILTFADGTEERIDITSGGNIGWWGRRQNGVLKHQTYRHNGYTSGYCTDGISSKTADGGDVTVYRLEHILPQGRKLVSVKLTQDPAFDAQIFLCKAEIVNV